MTPDQEFWRILLLISLVAFLVLLYIPNKVEEENYNLEDDAAAERRRKNMPCYGRHEWIVNTKGLRRCRKCDFEYQEDIDNDE